jgi:hypothetical protein
MIKVTANGSADERIRASNEFVFQQLLPVLEEFHKRNLSAVEVLAVEMHVSMLFMRPCPLDLLLDHDKRFANAMLQPRN